MAADTLISQELGGEFMKQTLTKCLLALCLVSGANIVYAQEETYDKVAIAARALYEAGDFEGAQKQLELGLSLATTQREKIDSLNRIALTYKSRELYSQAREQWNKVLEIQALPEIDRIEANFLIAGTYLNEKSWVEAQAKLREILNTPDIEAKSEYGARLALLSTYVNSDQPGRWDKARGETYNILDDPRFGAENRARATLFYGDGLRIDKQFGEARSAYKEVDNINGVPSALRLQALFQIAKTYEIEGNSKGFDFAYGTALTYGVEEGIKLSKADKAEESNALLKLSLASGHVGPAVRAVSFLYIGANYMILKQGDDAIYALIEAARQPSAAGAAIMKPEDLRWLRSSATSARVRLARIFIGADRKELAQKTITELLQDPNSTLDAKERSQLQQMLKSVS